MCIRDSDKPHPPSSEGHSCVTARAQHTLSRCIQAEHCELAELPIVVRGESWPECTRLAHAPKAPQIRINLAQQMSQARFLNELKLGNHSRRRTDLLIHRI